MSHNVNAMIPRCLITFLICLTLMLPAYAQGRRYGSRGGGTRPSANPLPSEALQAAVVHFEGTLRNFDKKTILLDSADGQTIVFRRSKNTAFIMAGNHSAIELGVKAQVEAHRDKVGDLDALRVCEGTCPSQEKRTQ